jgi:hypothetical protein
MQLIFAQVSASGAANGTGYPVMRGAEGRGKRVLYEVSGTCSFTLQTRANADAAWISVTSAITASGSQIVVLGPEVRVSVASATTATINVWVEDADTSEITHS